MQLTTPPSSRSWVPTAEEARTTASTPSSVASSGRELVAPPGFSFLPPPSRRGHGEEQRRIKKGDEEVEEPPPPPPQIDQRERRKRTGLGKKREVERTWAWGSIPLGCCLPCLFKFSPPISLRCSQKKNLFTCSDSRKKKLYLYVQ